jgi:hypothetical protein
VEEDATVTATKTLSLPSSQSVLNTPCSSCEMEGDALIKVADSSDLEMLFDFAQIMADNNNEEQEEEATAVFEWTLDEIDEAIVEAFMEDDADADVQPPLESSQALAAHHAKIAIQSKTTVQPSQEDPVVPDVPLTYCEMDASQLALLAADSDLCSRFYIVAAPSDKQLNISSSDRGGGGGTAVMAGYKVESAIQSKSAHEEPVVPDVPLTYCEMDALQHSRLPADSKLYNYFHIVAATSDKQLNIGKVLDEPVGSTCRSGGTTEIPVEFTDDKLDEDELDEELAFYTSTFQSSGTANQEPAEISGDAHDEDVESEAESTVVVQHSCLANENDAHDELPLLPNAFNEWMDDLVAERKALACAFHDSCVFGEPVCVY